MRKKFFHQDASKQTEQFSYSGDINDILARNIGPAYSIYRERFERAVSFIEEPAFPIHVDFETIFGCNLRCIMCTHAHKDKYPQRKRLMDISLYKQIIDDGVSRGLASIGLDQEGEPLLVDDLFEYISYARGKGIIDIMINTNALLLDENKTEELLRSGLTRIHFSLDAVNEETYKKIRVGSNFKKVVNNILYFCKRRKEIKKELPITRISFVKMKCNESEIDAFIKFWTKYVDAIAIQEYNNPFPGLPQTQDLCADSRIRNAGFRCTQPWFRIVVLTDGTVMPCCLLGMSLKMAIGNAYKNTISDLWHSNNMKYLRSIHKEGMYSKNSVCRLCANNFT